MIMRISLRRVLPLSRIKLRVSRRNGVGGDPQNGVKRRHRIKAAIESKHVLIEVSLQMFGLNAAMMRSFDPGFQVTENEMDHGQVRLSFIRVTTKRQHVMAISCPRKSWIAGPSVGAHEGTCDDVLFDKSCERFGTPVGNDAKPQPPRIDAAPVFLAIVF